MPRFRFAAATDVSDILALQRAYYAEDDYPWEESEARAALERLIADPSLGRVWVAADEDRTLGYAVLIAHAPRGHRTVHLGAAPRLRPRSFRSSAWTDAMNDVFTMVPASPRSLWVVGVLALLMLGLMLLFVSFAYSARATEFALRPEGLAIRRTAYGRTIPWSELEVDQARAVDLTTDRDLQPTWRRNGVGLPGYRAGWFNLRRRGRALLFVTDPRRVVAVPVRDEYTLLVSVEDPDAFISALRARAAPG